MTLGGYLSVEFDIKSSANRFCQGYMAIAKPTRDQVSTEEIEVDLPSGKRKVKLRMEGFQISEWFKTLAKPDLIDSNSDDDDEEEANSRNPDYYNKLEGTMSVIHTEGCDGGRAYWTIQYEKVSDDIKDPRFIVDTTARYFQAMDERIFSKSSE
ncbi:PREDICTED: uncharacterized protein At1g24010-like [Camelina sativa]|uniref:Uncharacterized protein At1g24010-like n=1 Tax=Camelina sativa TaxID=90675 RepID=A0ABM0WXU4_CAMSA|nr:PREDICTED: uncharacterized protein At1g24010-like [Camelina sativa]